MEYKSIPFQIQIILTEVFNIALLLRRNLYVSWSERLKSSEKREERPLIMFRTLISTRKVVKERVFFWVLRSKTKKNTSFFTTFPVEIYVRDTLSVDAFPFWVDFEFWPRIVFYVFQMPIFYSTCVLKEKASFISNL